MSSTIGAVLNYPHAPFQQEVIQGIRRVLTEHHINLIVTSDPVELESADGVLVVSTSASEVWIRRMYDAGRPTTLIAHHLPDLPIPSVIANNRQGIEAIMHCLVEERGCQRPLFIRGLLSQLDGRQRESAFRDCLIRHDLELPETYYLTGEFDPDSAATSLRDFLELGLPFDAVVAADYLMGIAVLDVLRKAGFEVPGQVSVFGFGDSKSAQDANLSTVAAEVSELGARAARQVIAQLHGDSISGITVISTRLVVRNT